MGTLYMDGLCICSHPYYSSEHGLDFPVHVFIFHNVLIKAVPGLARGFLYLCSLCDWIHRHSVRDVLFKVYVDWFLVSKRNMFEMAYYLFETG